MEALKSEIESILERIERIHKGCKERFCCLNSENWKELKAEIENYNQENSSVIDKDSTISREVKRYGTNINRGS